MSEQSSNKMQNNIEDSKIEPIDFNMKVKDLLDQVADCRIFIDRNGVPHRVCGQVTPELSARIDVLKGV